MQNLLLTHQHSACDLLPYRGVGVLYEHLVFIYRAVIPAQHTTFLLQLHPTPVCRSAQHRLAISTLAVTDSWETCYTILHTAIYLYVVCSDTACSKQGKAVPCKALLQVGHQLVQNWDICLCVLSSLLQVDGIEFLLVCAEAQPHVRDELRRQPLSPLQLERVLRGELCRTIMQIRPNLDEASKRFSTTHMHGCSTADALLPSRSTCDVPCSIRTPNDGQKPALVGTAHKRLRAR